MGNVFDDIRERSTHSCSVAFAEKLIRRGKETNDEIAELTGLPIEEVNDLAQKETT